MGYVVHYLLSSLPMVHHDYDVKIKRAVPANQQQSKHCILVLRSSGISLLANLSRDYQETPTLSADTPKATL